MKAAIVILVMMLIGGVGGTEALADLTMPDLKRGFESIVNPGELSEAHRIKEINDCRKCHEYYGEIPDSKCFSCHKIIQKRREAGAGYHGKKNDKCIHCHKEHPGAAGGIITFDKEKFDHDAAAFKLEGKHKDAKCDKCHKRRRSEDGNNPAGYYVGLRHDTCLDCHKDIHQGGFGEKTCETCHVAAGWKGKDLKFAHDRDAKFRLEGKHRSVKCVKCHKATTRDGSLNAASFKTKHGSCTDCHKDPHRGKFKATCETCHSAAGWRDKDLKFAHDRDAKFRLEGKHRSVTCVKCHKATTRDGSLNAASFKTKHDACLDCHKDIHQGAFGEKKCETCHSAAGWKGKDLKFVHDRDAKFRLEGKHRPVKCVKCHKATTRDGSMDVASFKTKHASCSNCHKDPHRGEIRTSCAVCHSAYDWRKNLTFDHGRDTEYRLEGKHRTVKCVKCHRTSKKSGLLDIASFRIGKYGLCAPCHKHKHKGTFIVTCDTCHTFDTWKRTIVPSPY